MSRPRAATSVATSTSRVALAEAVHDPIALGLVHAAVERGRFVAPTAEPLGQLVHLDPRPAEDERGRRILEVQDAAERGQLVGARARRRRPGARAPCRRRLALGVDRDPRRVPQVALRHARDGPEMVAENERRLARRRVAAEHRLEVLGEAHVEHLVRLVEDEHPHAPSLSCRD